MHCSHFCICIQNEYFSVEYHFSSITLHSITTTRRTTTMPNWFYMNRHTFVTLLHDELGSGLASSLIRIGFDSPVSFLIGETSNDILVQIQRTFSRYYCCKLICTDQCLSCSLTPPNYAKLIWFVQRLSIMSPLTKPLINRTSSKNISNIDQQITSSTGDYFYVHSFSLIVLIGVILSVFYFCK